MPMVARAVPKAELPVGSVTTPYSAWLHRCSIPWGGKQRDGQRLSPGSILVTLLNTLHSGLRLGKARTGQGGQAPRKMQAALAKARGTCGKMTYDIWDLLSKRQQTKEERVEIKEQKGVKGCLTLQQQSNQQKVLEVKLSGGQTLAI